MILVVGLGNPGNQYKISRHNFGFLALDQFAHHHRIKFSSKKFNSIYAPMDLFEKKITLVKPQTYMNLSGQAVEAFSHFFKIPSQNIIVIHDDIDLPLESIRIKARGGHAGHNGIKSITESLGTDQFHRVRLGIGRPLTPSGRDLPKEEVSNYVLSPFNKEEQKKLPQLFAHFINVFEKMLAEFKDTMI